MLNSFFLTSFIVFLDKQIKFTSFFVNQIISEYTRLHKVEWTYHLSNNINLPSTTKCFMSNKNLNGLYLGRNQQRRRTHRAGSLTRPPHHARTNNRDLFETAYRTVKLMLQKEPIRVLWKSGPKCLILMLSQLLRIGLLNDI